MDVHLHAYVHMCIHKSAYAYRCVHMDDDMVEWCPMTQREECGGTYIGVSECTRWEEYDGIGGGSKWGVSVYDGVG